MPLLMSLIELSGDNAPTQAETASSNVSTQGMRIYISRRGARRQAAAGGRWLVVPSGGVSPLFFFFFFFHFSRQAGSIAYERGGFQDNGSIAQRICAANSVKMAAEYALTRCARTQ